MSRYTKLGSVGVGIAALCAGVVAVFAAPNEGLPAASAAGCSDVDIAFARGTNDPPGFGDVGDEFVSGLTSRLAGKSVSTYAVDYPASLDFVRAGDGTNDLSAHIQDVARNCPKTQFVLGGYSQGGAVVDVLMGNNPTGLTYDNPLPRALYDRIAAVALFGNPKQWQVNNINVDLSIRPDQKSKVIDICNPGDMFCDPNGGGFGPHMAYKTDGSIDKAADFVVQRLAAVAASSPATTTSGAASTSSPMSTSKPASSSPAPTSSTPRGSAAGSSSSPAPAAPVHHGPPSDPDS